MTDDPKTGPNPLDPTTNADDLMGDTSGLTGITVNKTQSDQAQGTGSVANTKSVQGEDQAENHVSENTMPGLSDPASQRAEDVSSEDDIRDDATVPAPKGKNPALGSNISDSANPTLSSDAGSDTEPYHMPPSVQGELSVSGDMPDPESDDDTLANAQTMGMQPEEDSEHPQEVDIARDVDSAEESLRNS